MRGVADYMYLASMTIRNQSLLITYIVFVTKLQKKANPRKKYLPYWKFQI